MDACESMRRQLRPTGLYTLDGTTTVDRELAAYAEGLDAVAAQLRELQAESFVATASGYGLSYREQASALPASGTAEERRAALLGLGAAGRGSCTKEGIEAALSALGLSVGLEEDAADLRVVAHFLTMPACGEAEAQKKLEIFLPAHLSAESDFSGVS